MGEHKAGGIGLSTLLLVLFIGLKLAGVIAWSWLWVLAPLWLPLACVLVFLVLMGAIALTVTVGLK